MKSRTEEGKHTKRFIIEVKHLNSGWSRSGNDGLSGFFSTREEAKAAIANPSFVSENMEYRVRQK